MKFSVSIAACTEDGTSDLEENPRRRI